MDFIRIIVLAVLWIGTAIAQEAAELETKMRSGNGWEIVRAGNEYRVIVTLNAPEPIRSSYPTLNIDGVKYQAHLSKDRRTLIVPIERDQVDKIRDVNIGETTLTRRAKRSPQSSAPPAPRPIGETVPDPAVRGSFQVIRADYDLGDEVLPIAGSNIKSELRAAVYLPAGGSQAHPVIVFLHGMHASCYSGQRADLQWPCAKDASALPNHQGYDAPAEVLASHGYAVVSISANGVNAASQDVTGPTAALNPESRLRGKLILDHLDLLARANAGTEKKLGALQGRLNLQRVGLMGHSRGGEGVARAVLMNAVRQHPYGMEAILPLASTAHKPLAIPDIPLLTILPFCDGDVRSLEGQSYVDLSRHAFPDTVLRSSVLMMGANHNFFNTVWSPGRYPGSLDDALPWTATGEAVCGLPAARLTQQEQLAVGTVYIAGFFRMTMGEEKQFLPLFDGSIVSVPGVTRADVRSTATFPMTARHDMQSFEKTNSREELPLAGAWSWGILEGTGKICSASCLSNVRLPHDGTFLHLHGQGASASGKLMLQSKAPLPDASIHSYLSFRLGRTMGEGNPGALKLVVKLGKSQVSVAADHPALHILPTIGAVAEVDISSTDTTILQQVRLPLKLFDPADLKIVSQASLIMSGSGGILISDLAFVTPATGKGYPSKLPSIRIEDVEIDPSPQERLIPMKIKLSSIPAAEVSMQVSRSVAKTVKFAPGEQEKVVNIRIPGGWLPGNCPIHITAVRNAFVDREIANLRIRGENRGNAVVCNNPVPGSSDT